MGAYAVWYILYILDLLPWLLRGVLKGYATTVAEDAYVEK